MANSSTAKTKPTETPKADTAAPDHDVGGGAGAGMADPRRRTPHPEALDSRPAADGLDRHHVSAGLGHARTRLQARMAATFSTCWALSATWARAGFIFVTRAMDWGQGAIAHATADYGTKFLIVAGLLNFIAWPTLTISRSGKKP